MKNRSKILVDGNCVVCDLEVSHYKKMAPDIFDIIDISHPDFEASKYNLSVESVNRDLHVIDPEGKLHTGVDAFAHIWSRIPRYSLGQKVIQTPGIHMLARAGYRAFTVIRPYLPKKN